MELNLITPATGTQAGSALMQIAQTLIKTDAEAERSAVMTLMGDAIQNSNPRANVSSGIGGKVDVTA